MSTTQTPGITIDTGRRERTGAPPDSSPTIEHPKKGTGGLRALLLDLLSPYATPETTAADLADQFLVCVEGSIVLARIYDDPAYLQRGLEQFRRCLNRAEGRAA